MLVDTGANVTMVPGQVFDQIFPGQSPDLGVVPYSVQLADGHHLPSRGEASLPLIIGSTTLLHPVWVAEIEGEGILGSDFLAAYGCQLDLATKSFTLTKLQDGHYDEVPFSPQARSV